MSGIERRLRAAELKIVGPLPPDAYRYIERVAAERGLDPADVTREAVRILDEAAERGERSLDAMVAMVAARSGVDPAALLAEAERNLARWGEWSAA